MEDAYEGPGARYAYGFISRGRTSDARGAWMKDPSSAGGAGVVNLNLREEKIEEEWDGEMEMEMTRS